MDSDYYWLAYFQDHIFLHAGRTGFSALPHAGQTPPPEGVMRHALGSADGRALKGIELSSRPDEMWLRQAALCPITLRESYHILGHELYLLAGKGRELIHWHHFSRYCPFCGAKTRLNTPISKICPACGYEQFPAISPAILALVRKGNRILLARSPRFVNGFYSILAGFVETGETLEECVQREVMEESGISVINIRYFGNQPWPYPSGLMVGFTADYLSGEIVLRDHELSEAAFLTRQEAQKIGLPEPYSLARVMIDHWMQNA